MDYFMGIHLPMEGSKVRQMKKCGKLDLVGGKMPLYAPLSGTVTKVNDILLESLKLTHDPYGEGWLFRINPNVYAHPKRYKREVANLLNADAYRALISTEDIPGTVSVNSIAYTTKGGKNNDKDLLISIALVDHLGNPVSDASVEIWVEYEWGKYSELIGTTGIDGTVTFTIKNAPSGHYWTHIADVEAGDRRSVKKDLPDGRTSISFYNLGEGKKSVRFSNVYPGNQFYK